MRLDGRDDISQVVFWDKGAQPLLDAVTLEIFSLGIDPVNRKLIPVDAFLLESAACRAPTLAGDAALAHAGGRDAG